ncbi:MAG: glycosyltransferase family 2 protein [Chloroflexota bacterium]|nr:glycosyltransferase family 2 protein [Chloroflexota bacterium]
MSEIPSISFGLIVLNGEPFIRYTLRAIYPYAREIIVVEGATPAALNIATAGGHSRDSTLETLYDFKAREDPDDKLQIVTRDGFWSEKDEMSQAYATRATGDYLWQVDVDEFYQPADMEAVLDILKADPSITAVSFDTITFWGAPSYYVDSWYLRRGAAEYHRLFKWGAGYRYVTHRPPTVLDKEGRDLRAGRWIRGAELLKRGIRMYHYSLLLPKQVLEKCEYYSRAEWAQRQGALDWAQKAYLALERPYHAHNVDEYPGCLYRYRGQHPPQLLRMWHDIGAPGSACEIRPRDDIEALLDSWTYRGGRWLVMRADRPARILRMLRRRLRQALARCTPRLLKDIIRRR